MRPVDRGPDWTNDIDHALAGNIYAGPGRLRFTPVEPFQPVGAGDAESAGPKNDQLDALSFSTVRQSLRGPAGEVMELCSSGSG